MAWRRIGLTGGIGSGKSTVAAFWRDLGAVVIDADAISRAMTAPGGAALPALRAAFGDEAIGTDGALDRAWMRERAFRDPETKTRLERILHPLIGEATRQQEDAAGVHPVVFDVPLLTESSHWRSRVDRVLVVDCLESTQVQRVMSRSGWSADAVERVIGLQASRLRRWSVADAVIFNEGLDLDALRDEVKALWQVWIE